jgi:transglutaminase-like putative cysteine protease
MHERSEYDYRPGAGDWPLYAGALIAATGAMAALTVTTYSLPFGLLMHGLSLGGILTAFLGHVYKRNTTPLGLMVMLAGFVVLVVRKDLGTWTDLLFPVDLQGLEETSVATLAAWMLAGFCFMQARQYNSIFVAAAGMAILGLLATVNVNLPFMIAFWVYIVGIVFVWGYEHILHSVHRATSAPTAGTALGPWWRWHLSASLLLLSLVLGIATAGGDLLDAVVPRFFPRMAGQIRQLPGRAQKTVSESNTSHDFYVGVGPVRLPETEAFRVRTQYSALWRTQVYDYYTGSAWSKMRQSDGRLQRLGFLHYRVPEVTRYPGKPNKQTFSFPAHTRGFLPAASAPSEITLHGAVDLAPPPQPGGPALQPLQVDSYGCMRVNRTWSDPGGWGATGRELDNHYEVVSWMPPSDAAALRQRREDYPAQIAEMYVEQVTVAAHAHLSDLVAETVTGLADPYDRVVALRDMLAQRCMYSTQAPAVPTGKDAAVYFVMHSKQGACDLFATALTVTSRLAGVPARVAVGYQVGEYDARTDEYIVKHSDAHAWTEVFFPGVGWVPFDVQAEHSYDEQTVLSLLKSGFAHMAWSRALATLLPWLLVLLAAYVALSGVYDLRRRLLAGMRRRTAYPINSLGREFQGLCRTLANRGRTRVTDAMTPHEMLDAAMTNLSAPDLLRQRICELMEQYYEARFAPSQSARTVDRLRREVRAIRSRVTGFTRKPNQ